MRKTIVILALAVLFQSSMYPLVYAQEFTKTEELSGPCNYVKIISLSDSARENLLKLVVEDIDRMSDPTKVNTSLQLQLTPEQKKILDSTEIYNPSSPGDIGRVDLNKTLSKSIPQNHSLLTGFTKGYSSFLVELSGSLLICNNEGVCTKGRGFINKTVTLPDEPYSTVENRGSVYKGGLYRGIFGQMLDVNQVFVAGWSRIKFAHTITSGLAQYTDVIYGLMQTVDLAHLGVSLSKKLASKFTKISAYDSSVKDIIKDILMKKPDEAKINLGKITKNLPNKVEDARSVVIKRLSDLKDALEKLYTKDGKKIADLEVPYLTGEIKEEDILGIVRLQHSRKVKRFVEDINKEVQEGTISLSEIKEKVDTVFGKEPLDVKDKIIEYIGKNIKYENKKVGDIIEKTKDSIPRKENVNEIRDAVNGLENQLKIESLEKDITHLQDYLQNQIPSEGGWKEKFLNENKFILEKITKENLETLGYSIPDNNLYHYFSRPGIEEDVIGLMIDDLEDVLKTENPWAKLSSAFEISSVRDAASVLKQGLGKSRDPFFISETIRTALKVNNIWAKLLIFVIIPDISTKVVKIMRGALFFGSFTMLIGNAATNPSTVLGNGVLFHLEKTETNDKDKMIMIMSKDYAKINYIPTQNFIETFMSNFFETDSLSNVFRTFAGWMGLSQENTDELFNTFWKKLNHMGKYIILHDDVTPVFARKTIIELENPNEIYVAKTSIYHLSNNPTNRIVFENPLDYLKEKDSYFSSILILSSKIDVGLITNVTYGTPPSESLSQINSYLLEGATTIFIAGWVWGTATKALNRLAGIKNDIFKIIILGAIGYGIFKFVGNQLASSSVYWFYNERTRPAVSCEEVLKNTEYCVGPACIDKYSFFNILSMIAWGAGHATGVLAVIGVGAELFTQKLKTDFVKDTWSQLNTCYEDKYFFYGISETPIGEKQGITNIFNQTGIASLFQTQGPQGLETQIKEFLGKVIDFSGSFRYQPAHLRLVTQEKDFSIYKFDRIYLMYFTPDSEIMNVGEKPIEAEMNGESLIIKNSTITVKNKTTGKEVVVFEGPQAFFRNTNLKLGYFAIGNRVIEIDMNEKKVLFNYSGTTSGIDDCVKRAMEKLGMMDSSLKLESLSTPDYDVVNLGNTYKIIFHKDVPELDIKSGGSYETKSSDEIIIYRDGTIELKIKGVRTFKSELQPGSKIFFDNGAAYVSGRKMYLLIPSVYTTNMNEFTDVRMNNTENESGMHIGLHTGDSKVDAWTKHIDAVYKGERNCTERIDYKNNQLIISCSDGTRDVYEIVGLESSCVLLKKDEQKYVYTFQRIGNQIYNFIAPGESCSDASPEKAVFGPYPISYLWTPNGMVVFNPDTGKVELRNEFAFPLNPNFNYYGGLLQGNSFIPSPNPLGYTPNVDSKKPSGPSEPLIIPSIPEGIYGMFFLLGVGIVMILGHAYLSMKFQNKQNRKKMCR